MSSWFLSKPNLLSSCATHTVMLLIRHHHKQREMIRNVKQALYHCSTSLSRPRRGAMSLGLNTSEEKKKWNWNERFQQRFNVYDPVAAATYEKRGRWVTVGDEENTLAQSGNGGQSNWLSGMFAATWVTGLLVKIALMTHNCQLPCQSPV